MFRFLFSNWLINVVVDTIILMMLAGYMHTIHLSGVGAALAASLVLSVLNLFVKPILILFSLPVTILTLGLFVFVINALMLWITSAIMAPYFQIVGFGSALFAAVIMAICQVIIQSLIIKPLRRQ